MKAVGTRLDGVENHNTIIIMVITVVTCASTLAVKEEDRLRGRNIDKDICTSKRLTNKNAEYNKITIFIICT
jgi:hypothetical protein